MTYITRYGDTKFANIVKSPRDKVSDDVDDYSFPSTIVSTTIWGR